MKKQEEITRVINAALFAEFVNNHIAGPCQGGYEMPKGITARSYWRNADHELPFYVKDGKTRFVYETMVLVIHTPTQVSLSDDGPSMMVYSDHPLETANAVQKLIDWNVAERLKLNMANKDLFLSLLEDYVGDRFVIEFDHRVNLLQMIKDSKWNLKVLLDDQEPLS